MDCFNAGPRFPRLRRVPDADAVLLKRKRMNTQRSAEKFVQEIRADSRKPDFRTAFGNAVSNKPSVA
jgi:hypothetical protein